MAYIAAAAAGRFKRDSSRESLESCITKSARIIGHRPVIATNSFTHRNLVACIVAAAAGRSNRDSSRESLESSLEICAHHRPQTDDLHQIPSLEEIWWNASSPLLLEDPTETLRESCWKAPLKYVRIRSQTDVLHRIHFARRTLVACIIAAAAGRFKRESSQKSSSFARRNPVA